MTPELQRIAIAEACGWTFTPWDVRNPEDEHQTYECGLGKDRESYNVKDAEEAITCGLIPNYLNDLNAMHEAEKWLFASKPGYYERRYAMLVSSVTSNIGDSFCEYAPDGLRDVCDCIHATAAQRAEAFLRTIGKWEEGAP